MVQATYLKANPSLFVYSVHYALDSETVDYDNVLTSVEQAFVEQGCSFDLGGGAYRRRADCPLGHVLITLNEGPRRYLEFGVSVSAKGERADVFANAEQVSRQFEILSAELESKLPLTPTLKVGWSECFIPKDHSDRLGACDWTYRERALN